MAVAAPAYLADVVSKVVAVAVLSGQAPLAVVAPWFSLYLVRNPGAAFSAGSRYPLQLAVIAAVAAVVVLFLARRLGSSGWAVGLGFLLAGIAGNLTDRLFRGPGPLRGRVVDLFWFPDFPVFNVADVWISVAAVTIVVQSVRGVCVDGHRDFSRATPGTTRR